MWDKNSWNEGQNKKGRQGSLICFSFFSLMNLQCLEPILILLFFGLPLFCGCGGSLMESEPKRAVYLGISANWNLVLRFNLETE